MEKPLFKYKNVLRNSLIIICWLLIWLCAIGLMINYCIIENILSLIILSIITLFLLKPFKLLKISIYNDVITFTEIGFLHPRIYEFGIAFENIYEVKITNIAYTLNWIVIIRKNGKPIRRLFSVSKKELLELSTILNKKN